MHSAWVGQKARLRAIEPEDWEYYARFNSDTIQSRNVFRVTPPSSSSSNRAEAERLSRRAGAEDDDSLALAIEQVSRQGMIGAVSIKRAEFRSGSFEHGIAITGEYQRLGIGTEASIMLLRYMFGERRYHKSIVSVYEFNEPSLAFHRSLGYVVEGRLREQEFFGGAYCDVVIMGMLAREFFERHAPLLLERPRDSQHR